MSIQDLINSTTQPPTTSGPLTIDDLFPVRQPQRMSRADIEKLATLDAADPLAKGTLRAMLERADDKADPARKLAEMLLAVEARTNPADPLNPARVPSSPGATGKRPLGAVDLEWIRQLPADPAAVEADDVTALAQLVARAADGSERRYLERVFAPIRAHHDRAEAQARLDAARASSPTAHRTRAMEDAARKALAESIREALPELTENEALLRAADQLRTAWAAADAAHEAAVERAGEHLADVMAGRVPSETPPAGDSYEAGAERGLRERAAEGISPFEGMTLL